MQGVISDLDLSTDPGLMGALLLIAAALLYFMPTVIGRRRGLRTQGALTLVNLLFGWTMLGWLFCLVWALLGATRAVASWRSPGSGGSRAAELAAAEAYARERARLDHAAGFSPGWGPGPDLERQR